MDAVAVTSPHNAVRAPHTLYLFTRTAIAPTAHAGTALTCPLLGTSSTLWSDGTCTANDKTHVNNSVDLQYVAGVGDNRCCKYPRACRAAKFHLTIAGP